MPARRAGSLDVLEIRRRVMAKNMDRGNSGRNNKPKLSIQEKQLKKKMKQMAKQASLAPSPTP